MNAREGPPVDSWTVKYVQPRLILPIQADLWLRLQIFCCRSTGGDGSLGGDSRLETRNRHVQRHPVDVKTTVVPRGGSGKSMVTCCNICSVSTLLSTDRVDFGHLFEWIAKHTMVPAVNATWRSATGIYHLVKRGD